MDEKTIHTREFQLKGIERNMRCKLLQNRSTGKTTECSKHLQHITIQKDIFSELNKSIFQIFQISLMHIKLVIPKILKNAILIFTSKLCDPSHQNKNFWLPPPPPPPPDKTFLKFLMPPLPKLEGRGGGVHAIWNKKEDT